jgi:hypothetical protein
MSDFGQFSNGRDGGLAVRDGFFSRIKDRRSDAVGTPMLEVSPH